MIKGRMKKPQPFIFYECMTLIQPTGKQALDANQLLKLITEVEPGVIYHHIHENYLNAPIEVPEYPNDFAVWAAEALEDRALAEKLASLDVHSYNAIEKVRKALIEILKSYLDQNPGHRPTRREDAFFFNDAITIVIPTDDTAKRLKDFINALSTVATSSIYFHIFEARMRLRRPSDDFSIWLEKSLKRPDLAHKIRRLDPYHYSVEELRQQLLLAIQ
jgi:hypothetical protein